MRGEIPIPAGLHALVSVASAIALSLPTASCADQRAWRALEPEVHRLHRVARVASEPVARAALVDVLEVLLRFRASLRPAAARS